MIDPVVPPHARTPSWLLSLVVATTLLVACKGARVIDDGAQTSRVIKPKIPSKPRVLARGQGEPFGIALDAHDVYWTNKGTRKQDGSLVRAKRLGGTATVVMTNLATPYGVAVAGERLYFTEYDSGAKLEMGKVRSVSLDGFDARTLADAVPTPWSIAVQGDQVFFTTLLGHAVQRCSSSVPSEVVTVAAAQTKPTGLAVDATDVYWTDSAKGLVLRAPLAGGATSIIASDQRVPAGIAIDATHVYWASFDGGAVMRVARAGGQPEIVSSGKFHPRDVALVPGGDPWVYWVAGKEGLVLRAPKSGGAPSTLASDQHGPYSLAVDVDGVYWTNLEDGTVMAISMEDME